MQPKTDLNVLILRKMRDLGKINIKARDLIQNELMLDLSKHNKYWQSEHEDESEKLNHIRLVLSGICLVIEDILTLTEIEDDNI